MEPEPTQTPTNLEDISESNMTTPQPSRGSTTLKDTKKENTKEQWVMRIATSVVEAMQTKKEKSTKVAVPEFFKGDHKDTHRFLLDVKLFLWMNKTEYDTDEKKKMFLFLHVWGKALKWKQAELLNLFNDEEEDNNGNKMKKTPETWNKF
ncbi:hypothetical protein Moror_16454 [Moniliophthora roreri MCA 2997]|uniref:Uncharacterized protein n=1 Tax=Moniliophthora roreri (strain MCA 2997) TaxID=1381753 RepID=V2WVK8_MONRO|nr:hypothetical protein Moror_16454 [Moniliophthora roreri MCA 2997]